MAFNLVELADYGTTADQSSYSTPSVSPTAGARVIAVVANSRSGTASTPSISGFSQIISQLGSNGRRITVLRSTSTPAAGPVTATFDGNIQTGCTIWVGEIASGFASPLVVQATGGTFTSSVGPLNLTFGAAPASTSIVLAAAVGAAQNTYAYQTGFTEHSAVAHSTPMAVGVASDQDAAPQTVTVTPSADGINHGFVVVEFAAENPLPVASVTPLSQQENIGGTFNWDGSGSTGNGLSYAWTITDSGGTGLVTANLVGASTTTPSLSSTGATAGTGTIRLTVTDSAAQTSTKDATFTVSDPNATLIVQFWDDVSDTWVDSGGVFLWNPTTSTWV